MRVLLAAAEVVRRHAQTQDVVVRVVELLSHLEEGQLAHVQVQQHADHVAAAVLHTVVALRRMVLERPVVHEPVVAPTLVAAARQPRRHADEHRAEVAVVHRHLPVVPALREAP